MRCLVGSSKYGLKHYVRLLMFFAETCSASNISKYLENFFKSKLVYVCKDVRNFWFHQRDKFSDRPTRQLKQNYWKHKSRNVCKNKGEQDSSLSRSGSKNSRLKLSAFDLLIAIFASIINLHFEAKLDHQLNHKQLSIFYSAFRWQFGLLHWIELHFRIHLRSTAIMTQFAVCESFVQ